MLRDFWSIVSVVICWNKWRYISIYWKGFDHVENSVKAAITEFFAISWCSAYRMIVGQVKAVNRFPSASGAIIHTFVLQGDNSPPGRHNKSFAYNENGRYRPLLANAILWYYICALVLIKKCKNTNLPFICLCFKL